MNHENKIYSKIQNIDQIPQKIDKKMIFIN